MNSEQSPSRGRRNVRKVFHFTRLRSPNSLLLKVVARIGVLVSQRASRAGHAEPNWNTTKRGQEKNGRDHLRPVLNATCAAKALLHLGVTGRARLRSETLTVAIATYTTRRQDDRAIVATID